MQGFTSIDVLVVFAYLIGIAALGIYQSVRIKSSGDYFAGGRTFNKWLMTMHALGTGTHADDPVGVTGAAYQRGISGIWYTYLYLFCTPFYWLIAPFFRRSRFITTADFFEARYGSSMAFLYSVMGVVIFSVNTGTLLKGTGTIIRSVTLGAIPEWIGILVMTLVFVVYGLAGGLIATVVTESIQGVLIIVMSLLLIPFGLMAVGGFSGLHQLLEADKFSLHAPEELTLFWIIMASITALIGIVAQPHTMEICSTGKTEWEGRVGFTFGNFIKRFCAMGWAFTGLIVLAMVAAGKLPNELSHREDAFGVAIRELLPTGATGLMFAAILAAQMSTLSAFMVAGSALLARNIYRRYVSPQATDQQVLKIGRFAGLLVVALGLVFAFTVSGVAEALTIFWALSSLTGVFIWAAILWRRANATGAWLSFGVMAVIWLALGPFGLRLHEFFPQVSWLGALGDKADLPWLILSYLPAGILVLIIGSLLSRPMDQNKLDHFYLLLRTPVGREQELEKAGVEVVYAGETRGHPWELNHPRLVNIGGFLVALAFALIILALLYGLAHWGA